MEPTSDFQKKIVEYLESVHVGEFMTGTMDEVKEQVHENMKTEEYRDPTLCLMHLQNIQTVTVTNVNLVKIQLTGGKTPKILLMI
jgi:methanogenic corrinoid protein MtbC1